MNPAPEPDASDRDDVTELDALLGLMGIIPTVDQMAFSQETQSFEPVKRQPFTHTFTVDPVNLPADMPQHWKNWIRGEGEQP